MTRLFLLFLVAGCAAPASDPDPRPSGAQPVDPPVREADPELDVAAAQVEERAVLAAKYEALAQRFYKRGELDRALTAVRRTLALDPNRASALQLERDIEVNRGGRRATVELIAGEEAARIEVLREEELVTARKLVARGDRAAQQGQWEQAKRSYERALFLIETSRFRDDPALQAVSESARKKRVGASANDSRNEE